MILRDTRHASATRVLAHYLYAKEASYIETATQSTSLHVKSVVSVKSIYSSARSSPRISSSFPLISRVSSGSNIPLSSFFSTADLQNTPNTMKASKAQSPLEDSPPTTPIEGRRRVTKACQRCRLKKCKVRRLFSKICYEGTVSSLAF